MSVITDEAAILALNAVLKPLGSKLDHYMQVHRDDAIKEMRQVIAKTYRSAAVIAMTHSKDRRANNAKRDAAWEIYSAIMSVAEGE